MQGAASLAHAPLVGLQAGAAGSDASGAAAAGNWKVFEGAWREAGAAGAAAPARGVGGLAYGLHRQTAGRANSGAALSPNSIYLE